MKKILISVRPQWCEKIVSGIKTIEVRKTAPKEVPFKCYIYMTQGAYKDLGLYSEGIYQNRMKVIGEFICDKVIKTCGWRLRGNTQQCAKRTPDEEMLPHSACLSIDEIVNYAGGENGEICGWHISDLKIYDEPKKLSDFISPSKVKKCVDYCINGICSNLGYEELCGAIRRCEYKKLTRPPQSWQYVEELGNE